MLPCMFLRALAPWGPAFCNPSGLNSASDLSKRKQDAFLCIIWRGVRRITFGCHAHTNFGTGLKLS